MKRILVTGSRYLTIGGPIGQALCDVWDDMGRPLDATLVHGGARGADTMAEESWVANGLPVERHLAKWHLYGSAAGPRRNQEMVDLGADVCLAFYLYGAENRGTSDCAERARLAGIQVRHFTLKEKG